MKTIGILLHSLTVEYSLEILNGINSYFAGKDVKLIIGQTRDPHCDMGLYEYQCWASAEYLFSKQIDAYILITSSYSSRITNRALSKFLERVGDRPIVSIGMEISLPNAYLIKTECASAYKNIIAHLKEKHGCKKIAFMSAVQTHSEEALERFEAYKDALLYAGIPFESDLIIDGYFTKDSAITALKKLYQKKEEIPFDALICSNDLMAVGSLEYLQGLGIKVPEEVKIFGFDESSHAANSTPKISTIDQNIFDQGKMASAVIEKVLNNQPAPRVSALSVKPLYRQSCGCIPLDNLEIVHLDEDGILQHRSAEREQQMKFTGQYLNILLGLDDIYTLFDMAKSASTLGKTFYSLSPMLETAALESLAVFFFEDPIDVQKEDEIVIPRKMRYSMSVSKDQYNSVYEPGIYFDPREEILPDHLYENENGLFIIQPIFAGELTYGYIICKLASETYAIYSVFTKIIVNTLAQSFEFTKFINKNKELEQENIQLLHDNSSLDKKSKTDDLTKILNRRGFFEQGQKTLDFAYDSDQSGLIFFADMDGLKKINDTYGHKTGDLAIRTMAHILTQAFRANDVVGRLSGDEFGIVAPGLSAQYVGKIRAKIDQLCVEESAKKELPIILSCSMGYVPFNDRKITLKTMLSKADEALYIEKNQKHNKTN